MTELEQQDKQTRFNGALTAAKYRKQFKVNWKKIPKPEDLKIDVADAEAHAATFHADVQKALAILNPIEDKSASEDKSKLNPKTARKQGEWSHPVYAQPLLATRSLFNITGKLARYKPMALLLGKILNHQLNHQMKKTTLIGKLVRRVGNEGTVILKYGWDYQEKKRQEEVTYLEKEVDEYGNTVLDATGIPVERTYTKIEEQVTVLKNQPFIDLCKYDSIAVDPSCEDDITKATYIAHTYEVTMKDLINDPRYHNVQRAFAEAAQDAEADPTSYSRTNSARRKCKITEYWGEWDIHGTGVTESIVVAYIGNVIVRMSENPYPNGRFPFVFIVHTPNITPSIYGEPPALLIEDNQAFIGTIMRGASDTFGRSAMSQFLIPEGFLSKENMEKFSKGDNAVYRNMGIPPEQALHQVKMPELPATMFHMLQFLQNEVDSMSGSQSFSQGISGASLGSTAAGVNATMSAAGLRDMDVLGRITEGLTEIAYRVTELNMLMLSEEEMILLSGMEEDAFYEHYDPSITNMEAMTIDIDVATRAYNEMRSNRLAFLYQTKQSEMDADLSRDTLATILQLDDLEDFADQVRSFRPQPDPIAVATQQVDLRRKEVECDYIEAKKEHEFAKKDQTAAKSVTETAKAANFDAKTAAENLAFMQEFDGTKQTRQKEIINEQAMARSNADLNTEGGRNMLANAQQQADLPAEELTANALLDGLGEGLRSPSASMGINMDVNGNGNRVIDSLQNEFYPMGEN